LVSDLKGIYESIVWSSITLLPSILIELTSMSSAKDRIIKKKD